MKPHNINKIFKNQEDIQTSNKQGVIATFLYWNSLKKIGLPERVIHLTFHAVERFMEKMDHLAASFYPIDYTDEVAGSIIAIKRMYGLSKKVSGTGGIKPKYKYKHWTFAQKNNIILSCWRDDD